MYVNVIPRGCLTPPHTHDTNITNSTFLLYPICYICFFGQFKCPSSGVTGSVSFHRDAATLDTLGLKYSCEEYFLLSDTRPQITHHPSVAQQFTNT